MNDDKARRKGRQSIALRSLRDSVAGGFSALKTGGHDEVDELVVKVLKAIDQEAEAEEAEEALHLEKLSTRGVPSSRETEQEIQQRAELRISQFWTFFLAIPIIFTHGVATRMQFMYGGLYGRDGLHLNNALSILAVGFTAMGRATAPPLLSRFFGTPKPWLFMFLNSATLIGCSMMFLIPYVGGRENFNELGNLKGDQPGSVGTVSFFYFSMYIQGLAEVLSGWDMLMKFEMRKWVPEKQQLAFRVSFVSIALGSATAFAASAWLFEHFGLMGCAYLGVSSGAFNVVFPGIYLYRRWDKFIQWRAGGNKKRSVASRRSQPLMKIINLDEDGGDSSGEMNLRKSTRKLKFKKSDLSASTHSALSSMRENEPRRVSEYVPPRNYFEFQKQLQHQTAERLVNNFMTLKDRTRGFMKEQLSKLESEDVLAAFDPNLLLTHSAHIHWPKDFHKQIFVMRLFCIISLALGSAMISSQFAVYVLYLVDVWDVPVVFAGTSMAVGEISGMFTLLISIALEKRQARKATAEGKEAESAMAVRASTYSTPEEKERLAKSGNWRRLLKKPTLVLQVPSMFVVTCVAAVIPLGLLGSLSPTETEDDLDDDAPVSWTAKLIIALCSGVGVGIVNCVMHATTIEMAAMLLPEDLFGAAVAWGYSFRRLTNLAVCLLATGLYSINEHSVYQFIACVYAFSVPASIYVLAVYIKCMPWQKREVVFETTLDDNFAGLEQNGNGFSLHTGGPALPVFNEDDDEDDDEEDSGIGSIEYDDSDADDMDSAMFEKLIEKRLSALYGPESESPKKTDSKSTDSLDENGEEKKTVMEEKIEEVSEVSEEDIEKKEYSGSHDGSYLAPSSPTKEDI